jgi:DNA-binding response OmpR family regulator
LPKEILIVDDEPGIVVPLQFLMEQQGYNVMTAERGEDALELILPPEFCTQISAMNNRLQFYIFSAAF